MKLPSTTTLLLLPSLLATTAWCTPDLQNAHDIDWSSLRSALQSHTIAIPTKTANLENISPPPHSIVEKVVTGVPATVLAQLFVPAQRSALSSDFNAGHTPDWYLALPTDVKSYLSDVKRQVATGALTATGKEAKATGDAKTGGAGRAVGKGVDLWVLGGCAVGVLGLWGL
ncbi:hypothetical protein BO70DRAFT_378111 [Aspergillus heteromorphus CBS 117.55]|uniref:Uncharacterized protein n=1 Tax=Aspergillus heteromorphus CBS 117.55 TaxID=1448321 RepID=A0A317WNA5_9EURO|nr:uncharacterized protein BO70DRAFT_378111 [Aspergillus heteromorphus CBS 117.55]PWY87485.1 hypothetical protein BO70DRAFT_378111 [Aspergillus heteromorphus CBS 117.55]